jgi:hypothetical protein
MASAHDLSSKLKASRDTFALRLRAMAAPHRVQQLSTMSHLAGAELLER